MKKIICYGDSNTFGHNAVTFIRYDENTRWCGILRNNMSGKAEIIELGLNGRTIMTDDLLRNDRNAYKSIENDLEGISSDLFVVMLGTNDCKYDFGLSADDIADNMKKFLEKVKKILSETSPSAEILLISPVSMTEECVASPLEFDLSSCRVSEQLGEKYEILAKEMNIHFADADEWNVELTADGCHYTPGGHKTFAENVTKVISEIIKEM